MPSVTPEPFGRIIVEAQALGKIPIAFDHGGPSETIIDGKTGFLAEPISADSLAEKISLALSLKASKRKKMGDYNKKFVSKNFLRLGFVILRYLYISNVLLNIKEKAKLIKINLIKV